MDQRTLRLALQVAWTGEGIGNGHDGYRRHHVDAVLDHNRIALYMIEPQPFEAMLEELADNDSYRKAAAHLEGGARRA